MTIVKRIILAALLALTVSVAAVVSAQDAPGDVPAADYLFFFGGSGGTTEGIRGLAVKPDGSILVADAYAHISEFTPFGEFVTVHETDADGGAFGTIVALESGADRGIFALTQNPNAIVLYDAGWVKTQTIDLPENVYAYVYGLTYDAASGVIIVAYVEATDFQVTVAGYDFDGALVGSFTPQLDFPGNNQYRFGGLDVDPEGNIVHGFGGISRTTGSLDLVSGGVQVYGADGALLSSFDSTDPVETSEAMGDGTSEIFHWYAVPYGLAIDSQGRRYAYDVQWINNDITGIFSITAPDGTPLRKFTVAGQDSPVGAKAALSPDEKTLYVSTANFVHVISLTDDSAFTTLQLNANGNLRGGPGTNFDVVGALETGAIVVVTGQNEAGDWLKIRYNGGEAWVASFLTEPVAR